MDFKDFCELFITAAIVTSAIYIIYKRIRNDGGQCSGCGSCSKMCPRYNNRKGKGN